MSKKTNININDVVHDYMYNLAETMCENYCKYNEQFHKDQKQYDDKNPTYLKICTKCPLIDYFAM